MQLTNDGGSAIGLAAGAAILKIFCVDYLIIRPVD